MNHLTIIPALPSKLPSANLRPSLLQIFNIGMFHCSWKSRSSSSVISLLITLSNLDLMLRKLVPFVTKGLVLCFSQTKTQQLIEEYYLHWIPTREISFSGSSDTNTPTHVETNKNAHVKTHKL
jgi:hypothetical protein